MGRRKPVKCILCKEDTYDLDGLCGNCRKDAEAGQALREAVKHQIGEWETIVTVPYWDVWPDYGKPDSDAKIRISSIALKLAGAVKTNIGPGLKNGEKAIGQSERPLFGGGYYSYLVPLGTGELLSHLHQAICDLAAYHFQDGKRKGEDWLSKLVNGEISMSDLMKRESLQRKH